MPEFNKSKNPNGNSDQIQQTNVEDDDIVLQYFLYGLLALFAILFIVFMVLLCIKRYRDYQNRVQKREVEELCPDHFKKTAAEKYLQPNIIDKKDQKDEEKTSAGQQQQQVYYQDIVFHIQEHDNKNQQSPNNSNNNMQKNAQNNQIEQHNFFLKNDQFLPTNNDIDSFQQPCKQDDVNPDANIKSDFKINRTPLEKQLGKSKKQKDKSAKVANQMVILNINGYSDALMEDSQNLLKKRKNKQEKDRIQQKNKYTNNNANIKTIKQQQSYQEMNCQENTNILPKQEQKDSFNTCKQQQQKEQKYQQNKKLLQKTDSNELQDQKKQSLINKKFQNNSSLQNKNESIEIGNNTDQLSNNKIQQFNSNNSKKSLESQMGQHNPDFEDDDQELENSI